MSLIPISLPLSVPLITLPIAPHSLVTVSAFISLIFAVIFRIAFIIVHIIPISVALTATVPISSQILDGVFFKTRNHGLCI